MNLRIHLRLLHPGRAVLITACFTLFWAGISHQFFQLDLEAARLWACSIVLPYNFGVFVAGAAHSAMHRPFFLLLPDGLRRCRLATLVAVLIIAPLIAGGLTFGLAVPFAPALGLTAAMLTLPLLNTYPWKLRSMERYYRGLLFLGYLVLLRNSGDQLAPALQSAPWIFLFGGTALAAWCIWRGFSPRDLRERAHRPFNPLNSGFLWKSNIKVTQRYLQEIQQLRAGDSPARAARGRAWTMQAVGASSRDWMRVFWHANFGARPRGSFPGVQTKFLITGLVYAFLMPAMLMLLERSEYWPALAQPKGPLPLMIQTYMAVLCACLVIRPQLAYPISRERLARTVFGLTLAQLAVALVLPAATMFVVSLLGQIVTGRYLPGLGVTGVLNVDLPLAVLLPLLVAAGTLRRPIQRILAAVPIGMALMVLGITRPHFILTLPGSLSLLGAAVVSLWLLWHQLHREYATTDLFDKTNLGFSAFSPMPPQR